MRRFWQRWSYWDFEDKMVWVLKRVATLLALGFFAGIALALIWCVVVLTHLVMGVHHEDLIAWVCGSVMFAVNFYMLDDVLWG